MRIPNKYFLLLHKYIADCFFVIFLALCFCQVSPLLKLKLISNLFSSPQAVVTGSRSAVTRIQVLTSHTCQSDTSWMTSHAPPFSSLPLHAGIFIACLTWRRSSGVLPRVWRGHFHSFPESESCVLPADRNNTHTHTPPPPLMQTPSSPSQAWFMCVPWKRRNPHLSLSSR